MESLGGVTSSFAALGYGTQSPVLCAAKALHYSAHLLSDAAHGDLLVAVVVGKRETTNGLLLFGGPPRSSSLPRSLMANISTSVRMVLSSLRDCARALPPSDDSASRPPRPPSSAPSCTPRPVHDVLLPTRVADYGGANDASSRLSAPRPEQQRPPEASLPGRASTMPTAGAPRRPPSVPASSPSAAVATGSAAATGSSLDGASAGLATASEPGAPAARRPTQGVEADESALSGAAAADAATVEAASAAAAVGAAADVGAARPLATAAASLPSPSCLLVSVPGLLDIPAMIGSADEERKLAPVSPRVVDIPDEVSTSVLSQMRTYYQSDKMMLRQWGMLLMHASNLLIAKKTAAGKRPATIGTYRAMTPKACWNVTVKFKDGLDSRTVERPFMHNTAKIDEKVYLAIALVMAYNEQNFYLWLIAQFAQGVVCATGRKRKKPGQGNTADADDSSIIERRGGDGGTAQIGTLPLGGSAPGVGAVTGSGESVSGAPLAGGPSTAIVGAAEAAIGVAAAGRAATGAAEAGGEAAGAAAAGATAACPAADSAAATGAAAGCAVPIGGQGPVGGRSPEGHASALATPATCVELIRSRCSLGALYLAPLLDLFVGTQAVASGVCDPTVRSMAGHQIDNEMAFVHGGASVVRGCEELTALGAVANGDSGAAHDAARGQPTLQVMCAAPFLWPLACFG